MKKLALITLLISVLHVSYGQIYLNLKREILQGKNEKVEKKCLRGINSKTNDAKKKLDYYLALGDVQLLNQDYTNSEHSYRSADSCLALLIEEKKHIRKYQYDVKDHLANLYLTRGNYLKAEEEIRKNIEWRKNRFGKMSEQRIRSYPTLARYFQLTGEYDSAIYYSEKYIVRAKNTQYNNKNHCLEIGESYNLLSSAYLKNENYKKALRYAKKNEKYQFHKWTKEEAGKNTLNKVNAYNTLALAYLESIKFNSAERYSKKSEKYYDRKIGEEDITVVPILFTRARIAYNKEEYDVAAEYLGKTYRIQVKFLQKALVELSEYERERFYLENQDRAMKMNAYAMAIYEKHPGELYTKELMRDVFAYTLNTKGILLSSQNHFVNKLELLPDTDPVKIKFHEWKAAKNKLGQFMIYLDYEKDKEIINAQQNKVNELEKEIKDAVASKQKKASFRQPITMDELGRLLNSDEAFLNIIRVNGIVKDSLREISVVNDTLINYTYMILDGQNGQVSVIQNHNGKRLETLDRAWYSNHIRLKIADDKSYANYMGAIDSVISSKSRVIVLNDGVYNLINMGSLLNTSKETYVAEYTDLVTITSFSDLKLQQNKTLPIEGIALFGRPTYKSSDTLLTASLSDSSSAPTMRAIKQSTFSDLPGTEKEVKKINKTLADKNIESEVFLGTEASEENLKSIKPKGILHISTHGYFDSNVNYDNPLLSSGLILAGANDPKDPNEEDGILNAYEASLLNLEDVDLVVLSACETGLGEVRGGEGVYGLQRSFKSAGVDYVIMSLWKVDDAATEELMSSFYNHLVETENVRKAFNKAQIELKEKYPEPYYWSAFVLIGY